MCTLNGEMCTLECVCLDEATYARLRGMCTLGDEMQRDVARHSGMWRDAARCSEMWRDAVRCGEMQRGAARCSETWGGVLFEVRRYVT